MKLNVKFFATLKEKAQTTHLIIDLDDRHPTVKNLLVLTEFVVLPGNHPRIGHEYSN